MKGNESLILDFGNLYPSQRTPAPYFTFPGWWRRFLFQVLTRRELAVYFYLCCFFDPNGIAYPLKVQVMTEVGIINRRDLDDALDRLESLGFLLIEKRKLQRKRTITRFVFQRTRIEYTLLKLLEHNLIDAYLTPVDEKVYKERQELSVETGLQNLIGRTEDFRRYTHAADPEEKRALLIRCLRVSMERRGN